MTHNSLCSSMLTSYQYFHLCCPNLQVIGHVMWHPVVWTLSVRTAVVVVCAALVMRFLQGLYQQEIHMGVQVWRAAPLSRVFIRVFGLENKRLFSLLLWTQACSWGITLLLFCQKYCCVFECVISAVVNKELHGEKTLKDTMCAYIAHIYMV